MKRSENDALDRLQAGEFRLGYRPWLDGLRGWAILLVLACHGGLLIGGTLGVDVFFVLSGFLITSLLVEEHRRFGSIDLKKFYLRRALRLFPALIVLLAVFASIKLATRPEAWRQWGAEILVSACYLSNWPTIIPVPMSELGHTWSLSVEEQFYLLWPPLLAVALAFRATLCFLTVVALLGVAVCVAHRVGLAFAFRLEGFTNSHVLRLYMGLDTRADSLLAGACAAFFAAAGGLRYVARHARLFSFASLAGVLAIGWLAATSPFWKPLHFCGVFASVAVLVAVLILHLCVGGSWSRTKLLESRAIVALGRFSYAVYLYHVLIFNWCSIRPAWEEPLTWSRLKVAAGAASISIAAAVLSYYIVERPFLKLKTTIGRRTEAEKQILAMRMAA